MPFGQLVVGSPGAGKTTYCAGAKDFLAALGRKAHVVNLDPANDGASRSPYTASLDINTLIRVQDVMEELHLGPNGALLYCIEYLEQNIHWLLDGLRALLDHDRDAYVIFDIPGQVELSTNHASLRSIIQQVESQAGYRLVALHLVDASHITDVSRYISLVLLSLRAMLALELPHINVLSKIDLLGDVVGGAHVEDDDEDDDDDDDGGAHDLASSSMPGARDDGMLFNLSYYTHAQDLSRLLDVDATSTSPRHTRLNERICELVEDFGLVGFETLAVEDKRSMLRLTRVVDKAGGYVFAGQGGSSSSAPQETEQERYERFQPGSLYATTGMVPPRAGAATAAALFGTAAGEVEGWGDAGDVQERWLDNRDAWDEHEAKASKAQADEALERRVYAAANKVIREGVTAAPE
ncbi:hypothetical protein IE81DRAFT_57742 [Ceraceosorus guamensis]|uniref:GPN-loop GTPase 2 n=1 Tax=Ceraceosorus guamensis TaxID=1522189 RepID=A0A316VNW6_9BASI|nr:hypothetical protein IE81DRAFT_57742 [Ceraceosorus guamensis]PWN39004.1 hypothetical protein IE81DRAFT_57742 [Ceraceosorus guamensis]